MKGANVKTLLNVLPQRVRMDTEGLNKVEVDEHRRKAQYESFKNWVNKTKQSLLEQGIQAEETHETHVSQIAGSGSRQSNQRQGTSAGRQFNNYTPKGNTQMPNQNKQKKSKYDPCGFCNIIKENNTLQYGHLPFKDTHRTPPGKAPFPTQCLHWMMLEVDDRIRMIEKTTNFFCHVCLKIMGMDASASGKSCKENRHTTKKNDVWDSLCKHEGCKYNSTVCKNIQKKIWKARKYCVEELHGETRD